MMIILKCFFYLFSSLKLNLHNSSLYEVGVPFNQVDEMAGNIISVGLTGNIFYVLFLDASRSQEDS